MQPPQPPLVAPLGNYLGISRMSVVGKVFADVLLQPLVAVLEKDVYSESQYGYREGLHD